MDKAPSLSTDRVKHHPQTMSRIGARTLQYGTNDAGSSRNEDDETFESPFPLVIAFLVVCLFLCILEKWVKHCCQRARRTATAEKTEAQLRKMLSKTTMTVEATDLVYQDDDDDDDDDNDQDHQAQGMRDIEQSDDHDDGDDDDDGDGLESTNFVLGLRSPNKNLWSLRSATRPSSDRHASGVCAICLGSYEVGQEVSWSSTNAQCTHAFHTSCLCAYALRQQQQEQERHRDYSMRTKEIACPLCRQPFLSLK